MKIVVVVVVVVNVTAKISQAGETFGRIFDLCAVHEGCGISLAD